MKSFILDEFSSEQFVSFLGQRMNWHADFESGQMLYAFICTDFHGLGENVEL